MTNRPLSPLEKAILRAVVELGDEADWQSIQKTTRKTIVPKVIFAIMFQSLCRLEWDKFIESYQVTHNGRARRYWRPAFDLTEVLES